MTDLTTHKISFLGYHSYLAYRNGQLYMIQLPEKNDMPESWQAAFLKEIPQREKNLREFGAFYANKVIPVSQKCLAEAKTQQDKIVAFSMAYKHYRNTAYNSRDTEKSNIKNVPVNRKLLTTFFETPGLTNFTIDNYVHRINITKDYAVNGFPDDRAPKMPQGWDRDFWRTCDDSTRMAYEKALRASGYEKRITPVGTVFVET